MQASELAWAPMRPIPAFRSLWRSARRLGRGSTPWRGWHRRARSRPPPCAVSDG